MMKHYTAFIVCLMIVVLGVFPAEGKEYTVGLVPYIGFTPFVIADAKEFFAEEGAEVKLKYYLTQEEWLNAFFYKRYDMIIVWNAAHIGWYINGNHFVSIGAYAHEQGSYRLIAGPEVTPQTIASQKVGGASNAFSYQWMLWNYLKPNNIAMSAVNIVTLASEDLLLKNFLAGRLQAIMVRENFAEKAIQEGNGVVLSASTPEQSRLSILMHPDVYQATSQDDLKKMHRALVKALGWIADPANEQEFFTLVKAMFAKNPDYPSIESLEVFRKIRASTLFIEPQDLYGYNTTILMDTYDTMKTVLFEIDMPYDFVYNEVVDTSALLEALEEMGLTGKSAVE